MLQRTNKLFIGKDINRTGAITDGMGMKAFTDSSRIVDCEVVVLDKYKKVLAAGATIADTDTLFICQGTGDTFNYTNEAGTATTASVKVRLSDPIKGSLIKSFSGKSYTAKAEQVTVFDVTALAAVVVGTEYLVRIVYKDMNEHPGQFTATYRHIPKVTTLATFTDNVMKVINAHGGRRVQATSTATSITLTAFPIPECTSTLADLDKFSMVQFEAFLLFVNSTGFWQQCVVTSKATTAHVYGSGNWEQVRDEEKEAWGYLGVTNRTAFPVQVPTIGTVKSNYYDIVTIEHENDYLSPDNQYVKNAPLTTRLALATASNGVNAGTQSVTILAVLNPWMASTPGSFEPVTV